MFGGDRRMEAETYLSSGYGIRSAIEARSHGWKPFRELARAWMPGRLKGIQVSREYGTAFLAATQVFDVRPVPRKWLSLDRTDDSANRFVRQGMILVTCSGSVGRPTLCRSEFWLTVFLLGTSALPLFIQKDRCSPPLSSASVLGVFSPSSFE